MDSNNTSIDRTQLQHHLDDYENATGQRTNRFICPITLAAVDDSDLIAGHILNRAFKTASRKTVIQNRKVDGFYGTRVEPTLVQFLNHVGASPREIMKAATRLRVTLPDGTTVDAFITDGDNAKAAEKKYAHVDLTRDGESIGSIFIKLAPDDPRLAEGKIAVEGVLSYMPSHWMAAMVKAGFLAEFEMLGYSCVFNSWSLYVRNVLKQYYLANGSREDAAVYFHPFRNAVRFILGADSSKDPFPFDTLETRDVLVHMTMGRVLFAITYIFKVNGITIAVTLPAGMRPEDVAIVHEYYEKLMEDQVAIRSEVFRARFTGSRWEVGTKPVGVTFMGTPPRV